MKSSYLNKQINFSNFFKKYYSLVEKIKNTTLKYYNFKRKQKIKKMKSVFLSQKINLLSNGHEKEVKLENSKVKYCTSSRYGK